MVPSRYHDQYRRNQISTSSQGRLILMMYEGAIKFTTLAAESMAKGDAANQGKYIQKAHDIVNELSLALDFKKGGDVAPRLESLYQFALSQLTLANIKSDKKPLQAVLNILNPLLEAWTQLYKASTNTGQDEAAQPKNIASKC
ncbi:MAG: flagellar export chaperone FliS [Nitrospina sp.]|nr:flagellar export chaperone FliS [Nitrospina sp.]